MPVIAFVDRWGVVLLGTALVLVASAVNLLAPAKRWRIRSALIFYVLFALMAGASAILARSPIGPMRAWREHMDLFAQLLAAFTCVKITALALFDLVLPGLGIHFVAITADIAVGAAYVFAALGVLRAAGASPSSVVTTSAVASGVLALGLQTTLGNVIGGLALHLDGSVHVGDWIKLPDGCQGKVTAIRWRHTVLETRDWDTVIVPNASLLAQNIVILGKRAGQALQRRMWVYFNVDFRFAPSRVVAVVESALRAAPIEGVALEPMPNVICYDLAKDGRNSFAYYAVRYWLTDLPNDDPTNSRIRARVFSALRRASIPFAVPSHNIVVLPEESAPARDARHNEERLHAIEQVDLFKGLTPAEREFLASHLVYAPFTSGETATKQGAVAHWLYILREGTVEVRRHGDDDGVSRVVATIAAPSFFGEMGVLTGEPRTADVVAVTDVECYRLEKAGLQQILHDRPEVADQLSRAAATRETGLEAAVAGLSDDERKARMAHAELRILDKIQDFFGLERTGASRG